jgi:hypothetical protein
MQPSRLLLRCCSSRQFAAFTLIGPERPKTSPTQSLPFSAKFLRVKYLRSVVFPHIRESLLVHVPVTDLELNVKRLP